MYRPKPNANATLRPVYSTPRLALPSYNLREETSSSLRLRAFQVALRGE